MPFASKRRAVSRGAPRKNHTWGFRRWTRPIQDVGSADRRESVAGARCRCGFRDTWLLSWQDSSVARDGSDKGLARIVDEGWRPERAVRPSEGIPKGGTCVLAVCTTLGQLDYFVTLALQQHAEQSALRKGRDQFSHDQVFLFFLSEDFVIYRVGERPLRVFSERLTVSCYANLRLGREPTNL